MELTQIERDILTVIAQNSRFTIFVVKKVYEQCKSFDVTIAVLRLAVTLNISTLDALNQIEKIQHKNLM